VIERSPTGVFLSHSSLDKPFVTRLAIDLLKSGIPVWFDKWEMDTGDSLLESIADGISDTTRLVLVLSKNSIGSSWVKRELRIALEKEERVGGTFLLPVRLDECEIPLLIGDRLYADFRDPQSYYESLDRLTTTLIRSGAENLVPKPENELIAIEIRNGIHLLSAGLKARLNKVLPRIPAGYQFKEDQFVFGDEPEFRCLKAHCHHLLLQESRATGVDYDSKKHDAFEELNQDFRRYDRICREGLVEILNGLRGLKYHPELIAEACLWFVKEVRTRLLKNVRITAADYKLATGDFNWLWTLELHGTSEDEIKAFYEVEQLSHCKAWANEHRTYNICLDANGFEALEILKFHPERLRLTRELTPNTLAKYVVPSMVYDHLVIRHYSSTSISSFDWGLDSYYIVPE
jgi:TIR domain